MNQRIRNDGKPARTPRLGIPATRHNGLKADPDQPVPMWAELVQPGPKGNPSRTLQRRLDRGQVVTLTRTFEPIARPVQQGGAVRLGLWRATRTPKTGVHAPSEHVRAVKGSRTGGLVEVRRGNARERMDAVRQRPADIRRAERRAARLAVVAEVSA